MRKMKFKAGFSLIEILVSTALFVIILTAAMNIFKIVIESQRTAIATQNVEESLKYFLEVTSKEIRMAKRNNNLCALSLGPTDIYKQATNSVGDTLAFRNYHDECVLYSLVTTSDGVNRFMISRNNKTGYYITPSKINIDELRFIISDTVQPTVTMELVAHALGNDINKSTMRIQTTLSSRYYKTD